MGGGAETVFPVPWKVVTGGDALPQGGLAVYWFPASQIELEKSSLRNSRTLTLYSQQCVLMGVADVKTELGQKFAADAKLPVAVLADSEGKVINKAAGGDDGKLKVQPVEKMLEAEMKQRESVVKGSIEAARDLMKKGDKDGAINIFHLNAAQFPQSGNVWDSLAEAYAAAGKNVLAEIYYRKSLELDPQGANALEKLRKLGEKPPQ